MDWPQHSIESIPGDAFVPPFCPRQQCADHGPRRRADWIYWRCGEFSRKDGRTIPRYQCRTCGRTFSQQTFAFSYYLKRPELSAPIFKGLCAGSGFRPLSRSLGASPSTIALQSARLGRHLLLLLQRALELLGIDETLVHDDFESFAYSQYFPASVGTTSGQESWYVFGLSHATHRRGGSLSPHQRRQQRALDKRFGKAPRGARASAFAELLQHLLPQAGNVVRIVSDDDPIYRSVLARHRTATRIDHEVHANPRRGPKGSRRSDAARARDRALFPLDRLHRLVRHSGADHRRETIAFSRLDNALMERMAILVAWHNFAKRRRENLKTSPTPAQTLGLVNEPWAFETFLHQRLFPTLIQLPPHWQRIYDGLLPTLALPHHRTHRLKLAY